MRAGIRMVTPRTAVQFGGVLERLQVVSHRDHRKEDHDDHQKRDNLCARTGAVAAIKTYPYSHEEDGQHYPNEIEGQLHYLT